MFDYYQLKITSKPTLAYFDLGYISYYIYLFYESD
jgi:hypothetical protein